MIALPADPLEPRNRKQRRIRHALVELPQPRIDIAAERHHHEVRPVPQHLRRPPDRRRSSRAPGGSASTLAAIRDTKASRTSSRSRNTGSTRPSGSTVDRSLLECTPRSISPASSAASISRENSPLPPAVLERHVLQPVAARRDHPDLDRSPAQPWASHRSRATRLAWTSASAEPRVPSRKSGPAIAILRRPIVGQARSGRRRRAGLNLFRVTGKRMLILGIETSCDETAAAVVRRDADGRGEILSATSSAPRSRSTPPMAASSPSSPPAPTSSISTASSAAPSPRPA